MAERLTVARPYAEAVFSLALEQKSLALWLARLSFLRAVCADAKMSVFLDDPNVTAENKIAAIVAVCGEDKLGPDGKRFVDVLTRAKRLTLMPEIETLFKARKDAAENIVQTRIETALPIDEAQIAAIKSILKERAGKGVETEVSVNPSLIGGVRLFVGDQVIDASVRGRLQSMAQALRAP
ncbi:MAG: F0F1 ATP synthase subunit delta [Burkholderiales bacterium]|jgi:F-type H+-transporting ATPase subunit delta|nr:F0F1 ATP synthase subunit delta [Burkholderiales bacterium]